MTYLDTEHTRRNSGLGATLLRLLAILAVIAFGWFAFTIGNTDGNGRADIVQEPMARTF